MDNLSVDQVCTFMVHIDCVYIMCCIFSIHSFFCSRQEWGWWWWQVLLHSLDSYRARFCSVWIAIFQNYPLASRAFVLEWKLTHIHHESWLQDNLYHLTCRQVWSFYRTPWCRASLMFYSFRSCSPSTGYAVWEQLQCKRSGSTNEMNLSHWDQTWSIITYTTGSKNISISIVPQHSMLAQLQTSQW